MRALSLVEQVGRLLERTYGIEPGIGDVSRFLIGDRGFARIYGSAKSGLEAVSAAEPCGARMLVRQVGAEVRACVYYPDAMIERLERNPPQLGLDEGNIDDFAALVEELDHLLFLATRVRGGRPTSLFELELHANVSKHLVLARFLAGGRRRLGDRRRVWLRHHLFGKYRFSDPRPGIRRRYEEAERWAVRFLDRLGVIGGERRLALLREFHRASTAGKLALVERLGTA